MRRRLGSNSVEISKQTTNTPHAPRDLTAEVTGELAAEEEGMIYVKMLGEGTLGTIVSKRNRPMRQRLQGPSTRTQPLRLPTQTPMDIRHISATHT